MGKETNAMRSIQGMCNRFGYDPKTIMCKSKMILALYRDVVWASMRRADDLLLASHETLGRDLGAALVYLNDFAPEEERHIFESRVSGLFETKWYIDLVDTAMVKVYDYPAYGRLYHGILAKAYLSALVYSETELLEAFGMERSMYFQRKKEALLLAGIALWGYAIPTTREIYLDTQNAESLLSAGIREKAD